MQDSPRFKLTKANIPSVVKSAIISALAILVSLGLAQTLHYFYPEADLSVIDAAIMTAASGWVVNLIKEFVEQK